MKQYLDLMRHTLNNGILKSDRTGTGTLSSFGHQLRFDLSQGFPLVTTKECHLKSIIHELLWMLSGDTNIKYLNENGVTIWNEWANAKGDLGPVYGKQWRSWPDGTNYQEDAIDQISWVVSEIERNPDSRRLLVSAWNTLYISNEAFSPSLNVSAGLMALPPCHVLFQFYVANGRLSCQLYQRSADIFLGLPFNIASYSLLTMMVAKVTGLQLGEFIHTIGDAHLYLNHMEQAKEQLTRRPRPLPRMIITDEPKEIFDFSYGDFSLEGYSPHPKITAPVAV